MLLFFKRLPLGLLFRLLFLPLLLCNSLLVLLIELFPLLSCDLALVDLLILPVLHPDFLLGVVAQLFADRVGKQVDDGYTLVDSAQVVDLGKLVLP